MSDEIKEILSKMERLIVYGQYNAYYNLEKQILDYITNLQQENERLKEEVKFTEDYKDAYETTMLANKLLEEKYNDYKSRVEKASQYTKNHTIDYVRNGIECCKIDEYFNPYHLIDILEG